MGRPKGVFTRQITSDEKKLIRTLYFDGNLTQKEVLLRLRERGKEITPSQIKRAIRSDDDDTHWEARGRPPVLTEEQSNRLIAYVTSSKIGRRATWAHLALISFVTIGIQVGLYCIRSTLRRAGYKRYVARKKPPITEKNRVLRLQWARDHEHWTAEQWSKVLWTDETWVTGGPHRKQYVTRKADEIWDPNCVVAKHQRKGGWMFWACFSGIAGHEKGPSLFWEKEWGTINEETYRDHTVPLIDGWVSLCRSQLHEDLILMQDNASAHTAAGTIQDLSERGVTVMEWPPFSPDLNPIETVWCRMKDYIEHKYGHIEKPSYAQLRGFVKEAWEQIDDDLIKDLLASMPERCKDVIAADGRFTKW